MCKSNWMYEFERVGCGRANEIVGFVGWDIVAFGVKSSWRVVRMWVCSLGVRAWSFGFMGVVGALLWVVNFVD